jgi:ABC-2 type transport system ATP-binding protein
MNAIEIKDLSVVYKGQHFYQPATTVLHHVSLNVEKGEVLGLIGPNGAGKTTLIKALLGFVFPKQGEIKIFGEVMPKPQIYKQLGYLPEQPIFYGYLTAAQLLDEYASLFHLPQNKRKKRIKEVLDRVGLGLVPSHKKLGQYSKGMLQRFGLAQAILHDPPLLILDEPMSGLDPMGRHDLSLLIQALSQEGKTIVFVSHILHDVETLSDRICIMNHGHLIETTEIDTLLSSTVKGIQVVVKAQPELQSKLEPFAASCVQSGHRLIVVLPDFTHLHHVVETVQQAQGTVIGIDILRDSLEDYFLKTVRAGVKS